MANDNKAGGRTFLAIVLGGIVLALVIAAYFMYGHKGEPAKVEAPAAQAPAPAPAPAPTPAPAPEPMAAPPAPAPAAPAPEAPAPTPPTNP
jgi:flagellar basal body-associated protein FliL